ncbi:hypothetical protein LEMLEM_LOCUS8914 [Lemmus lemmus]
MCNLQNFVENFSNNIRQLFGIMLTTRCMGVCSPPRTCYIVPEKARRRPWIS